MKRRKTRRKPKPDIMATNKIVDKGLDIMVSGMTLGVAAGMTSQLLKSIPK